MAGQASVPALLCGPSTPSVHAKMEGEGERGGVGVGGGISLCRVCVCSSANFFRTNTCRSNAQLGIFFGTEVLGTMPSVEIIVGPGSRLAVGGSRAVFGRGGSVWWWQAHFQEIQKNSPPP